MKKLMIIASMALMMAACGKKEKAYDATGTFEATEVTISAKATGELKSFDVTDGILKEMGIDPKYAKGRGKDESK